MAKIAILGDTHFGARNDSEVFNEYFFKFYENVFFPYCVENGISRIIQTGDFMDRRKSVNFKILHETNRRFMDKLAELIPDIKIDMIPGNHDIYYRYTNEINSLKELFSWRDFVVVHDEQPTTIEIDGLKIDMIPWINKYNFKNTLEFIENSMSDVCVGHFEIVGFDMQAGIPGHGGLDRKIFSHYDLVLSGHYHTKSEKGNIRYVGTPYEITWSDYDDPKGFHVLDTESRELEFIKNPYKMFHKAFFCSDVDYEEFDFKELEGGIVKVIVKDRNDSKKYDWFLDKIIEAMPNDFSVVESDVVLVEGVDAESFEALDTFTVLRNAAASVAESESLNKKKMQSFIQELYTEAVAQGRDQ